MTLKDKQVTQKGESKEQQRKAVPIEAMMRFNNPQMTRRVVAGQPMVGGRAPTRRPLSSAPPRAQKGSSEQPEGGENLSVEQRRSDGGGEPE